MNDNVSEASDIFKESDKGSELVRRGSRQGKVNLFCKTKQGPPNNYFFWKYNTIN